MTKTTQLAETAVDMENTKQNEQPTNQTTIDEQRFNEVASNVLCEMETPKAKTLRLSENACEIIALDLSDCVALADMLDTVLLNSCFYDKPITKRNYSFISATVHALHDLAEKVFNCVNELIVAIHREDFAKIKELLPYVED